MVSHRVSRSVRRFVGGLIVLAFLATLAAPAQAAPGVPSAAPSFQLVDWLQELIARLGWVTPDPEPAPNGPGEPRVIFGKEGQCIDPNGLPVACPTSVVEIPEIGGPVG